MLESGLELGVLVGLEVGVLVGLELELLLGLGLGALGVRAGSVIFFTGYQVHVIPVHEEVGISESAGEAQDSENEDC